MYILQNESHAQFDSVVGKRIFLVPSTWGIMVTWTTVSMPMVHSQKSEND